VIIVAAGAVIVAVILAVGGSHGSDYTVAAEFDTARGMVPGQLVKVAGSRVGKVSDVQLLAGPRALVTMKIERRFAPFRDDARCSIRPEGFISENYIDCEPGSASRPGLADRAGVPTVPIDRTATPVTLQDVVNVFSLPTDQRLRILLTELGIASASRGRDLNAVVRRLNPALGQARRALRLLGDQRRQIGSAVSQTNAVLGRIASDDKQVSRFVDRAAAAAQVTAARAPQLSEGVKRLAPMLGELQHGLGALRRFTRTGTPMLDDLRQAAPALQRVAQDLPGFSRSGRPAVRSLVAALARVRRVVPRARTPLRRLEQLSGRGQAADMLARFLSNSRDRGVVEGFYRLMYGLATTGAPYDSISHQMAVVVEAFPNCLISNQQARGCKHSYSSEGLGRVPINAPTSAPAARKQPSVKQVRYLLDYLLR
jgi:phospholipid/cholesterol/gamma-HCH transport system substrate-binding protein